MHSAKHATSADRAPLPTGVLLDDNLAVLSGLPSAVVDLIYIDPPFGTGKMRRYESIRTGSGDKTRRGFGNKMYRWHTRSVLTYDDSMGLDEYVQFMAPRLREAHRVLKDTGSIYVHCDYRVAHHVRVLLDETFGAERFLNEVIWSYDFGGRPRDRWPKKHDNIYWYAKGDRWTFNRHEIDRLPYMAPALVGPEKAAYGKVPTDVWWLTIVHTSGTERTGYPTQKPERLLERIVRASSNRGDYVVDFFGGSGTTGVVAARLGRRFLLVDNNADAVRIARQRIAAVVHVPEQIELRPETADG